MAEQSATSEITDADISFRSAVARRVRWIDCLLLVAVPVVLLGVFTLPESSRHALTFVYDAPTLPTAFTAHLVHFRVEHLVANVLGYLLLAGTGYLLAVLAGRRRLFGVVATAVLVAFPPSLAMLNLAVPRRGVTYGFSGVNAAFAGVLAVLLPLYVRRRLVPWVDRRHAPGGFFVVLSITAVVALPLSVRSVSISLLCSLLAFAFGRGLLADWRRISHSCSGGPRAGWVDLFVVASVLCLGYPVVGFGGDIVAAGTVANDYVHLLGFCLGFVGPYVGLVLGLFDEDDETS